MCRPTSPTRRNERGLSSSVLASILFPLAISILWLAMQWAMLTWAHATAQAAAQDGARAAAALDATTNHGHTAAASAADNGALDSYTISAQRGTITTTVTVTGTAHRVIPGFPVTINVTATAPTQRITSS